MTEEQEELEYWRKDSARSAKEIKTLHKFIKQLAAAYRMTDPMHYVRTCKCDMCVLLREARDITK
jgi:hypothetical protein